MSSENMFLAFTNAGANRQVASAKWLEKQCLARVASRYPSSHWALPYSYLSATMGSTLVARRAGT